MLRGSAPCGRARVPYREALTIRLDAAEIRVADEEVQALLEQPGAPGMLQRLATSSLSAAIPSSTSTTSSVPSPSAPEWYTSIPQPKSWSTSSGPPCQAKHSFHWRSRRRSPRNLPPSRHDIVGTSLEGLEVQIADAVDRRQVCRRDRSRTHYSDRTIRRKLQGIYLKLGVQDRPAAVERLRATTMAKIDDGPAK